jgi:hypothetical protein
MIDQLLTPINNKVFAERVVKACFYLEFCPGPLNIEIRGLGRVLLRFRRFRVYRPVLSEFFPGSETKLCA